MMFNEVHITRSSYVEFFILRYDVFISIDVDEILVLDVSDIIKRLVSNATCECIFNLLCVCVLATPHTRVNNNCRFAHALAGGGMLPVEDLDPTHCQHHQ